MRSLKVVHLFAMYATLGCVGCLTSMQAPARPDAGSSSDEDDGLGQIICEETSYSQEQFTAAFNTAVATLAVEGYEVVPLTWEDANGFSRLVQHMIEALGCASQDMAGQETAGASSRRNGSGMCRTVFDLSQYRSAVMYCGPGARLGNDCPPYYRFPGDCLNRLCYQHDRCYEGIIQAQGPVCLWSNETSSCDNPFHVAALACGSDTVREGFWRLMIETIAGEIDLIQDLADVEHLPICLYGTACPNGTDNCDGDWLTRCEADLRTDSQHCGDCATVCDLFPADDCVSGIVRGVHTIAECRNGRCVYPVTEVSCDDSDPCTSDACGIGRCVHALIPCDCEDGDERPCGSDEGTCQAGTQTCESGTWSGCEGEVGPSSEICDGLDNDCDGAVDDGLGTATCGMGTCARTVENCVGGVAQSCTPGLPAPEVCDELDNDCDGVIDNGSTVDVSCQDGSACNGTEGCASGRCVSGVAVDCNDSVDCTFDLCLESAAICSHVANHAACDDWSVCTTDLCTPTGCASEVTLDEDDDGFTAQGCGGTDCDDSNPAVHPGAVEVCDGQDNDCDGSRDVGFTFGACTNGLTGACLRFGSLTCRADGTATECSATIVAPVPEICNGVDDDCDGIVDDSSACCPTTPCESGQRCCSGVCVSGSCCDNGQCQWWNGSATVYSVCSASHTCVSCTSDAQCNTVNVAGLPAVCCAGVCYPGDCCSDFDCPYDWTCFHPWGSHTCNRP